MSYSRNVFIINNLTATFFKKSLFYALKSKYISPVCLFYGIFRVANFSSDPFDFRLRKRDNEAAPSLQQLLLEPFTPIVFTCSINRKCFGDLYLWCEGRFFEIDPAPHSPTAPTPVPPIHFCTPAELILRLFN